LPEKKATQSELIFARVAAALGAADGWDFAQAGPHSAIEELATAMTASAR
jgi:hypothetical protein